MYNGKKMKNIVLISLLTFFMVGCDKEKKAAFIERVQSQNTQEVSVKKLQKLIQEKELTLFETLDHQANAKAVKMDLKPETVVIFGNPKMGTVLMRCNPSIGLDLPLRILVSTDYEGITTLSYTNPEYWSLKHNIKDKNCLDIINKAAVALEELAQETSKK
jgi:uncharacterized protein (DUF302 family)